MKKIIRKLYWNPQKEENWINALAAKGLALTDYSWARYVFEDAEPGEYIYRIELLEKSAKSTESGVYLRFLEESGVAVVAYYWRWVFLRKKSADGPFALYSDNASRISQLKRIERLFLGLSVLETMIGIGNLAMGVASVIEDQGDLQDRFLGFAHTLNLVGGGLCLTLGIVFFFTLYRPIHIQIRKLLQEKVIFE